MNKKRTIVITMLMITLFFGCRKDFSAEENLPTYLKEAKSFYYGQAKILGISSVSKQKIGSDQLNEMSSINGLKRTYTPVWQRSYVSKAGSNDFAEVPLITNIKLISLYNVSKKETNKQIELVRVSSSFKRLLIYKTKLGNFHQLQLTYIPDYDYLARNNFDASSNHINDIADDFSGYIEYSTIKDDKKIFILHFENGKLIGKKYFNKAQDLIPSLEKSKKLTGKDSDVSKIINAGTGHY